jgi:hypothetical protein
MSDVVDKVFKECTQWIEYKLWLVILKMTLS